MKLIRQFVFINDVGLHGNLPPAMLGPNIHTWDMVIQHIIGVHSRYISILCHIGNRDYSGESMCAPLGTAPS